jgi:hypothetical protein
MKTTLLAAMLISVTAVSAAQADNDHRCPSVPVERWMSEQQIRERATTLGLEVRKIKIDDGCYEVKARNRDGRWQEIRFHPETGAQVSVEDDD